MAKKFSGAGAKQMLIDHAEKLGLGVAVLLVLMALATANWVPFKGDPNKIRTAAEEARKTYDARVIQPNEEVELQLVVDEKDRPAALVDRELLSDWPVGPLDLRLAMAVSPNDKKSPFREPAFDRHPIRNLIANSSVILLNLGPEVPPAPEPGTVPPGSPPGTPPATPATPMPPAIAGVPGFPGAAGLDDRFAKRTNLAGGTGLPGSGMEGAMDYYSPELAYFDSEYTGESGDLSYAGTKLKGRGQAYISVRGIIPLHELIRDVMEAKTCDFATAAQHFQLIDYVLDRQTMLPNGQWPADDQWEQVDRTTAEGILKEVDGFDPDPVPPQLTDWAVTMPLPARITGVWKALATHPDIENFSLSEKDMENELKYQRALLKKVQEQQAQQAGAQPQQAGPKVKGWNDFVHDSRRLASQVLGSESSYGETYEDYNSGSSPYGAMVSHVNDQDFNKLVESLAKSSDKNAQKQADEELKKYIKKRITAVGNILLFRFVDFAVEPGKTYRYRARLMIENPNFGERVVDALDPSVVQGETRENAWSNITDPVTVQRDTHYFVYKLETNRSRALFDFYHFDPTLGTVVTNTEPDVPEADNLNNVPRLEVGFGQPIGGTLTVWELSPGAMTFEKDEKDVADDGDPKGYSFQTGDLLVTGLEEISVQRQEHPDLKIPREQNFDLQLASAVLIQKKSGELTSLDNITQEPMRQYQIYLVGQQNEPFRELKKGKVLAAEGDMLDLYGSMYDPAAIDSEGAGMRRASTRTRNQLRKSTSRADAGVMDAASRNSGRGRLPGP